MSLSISRWHLKALVLDIEGTTTPVEFVYQVLFPYARAHVAGFLEAGGASDACREAVARLRDEHARDLARGSIEGRHAEDPQEGTARGAHRGSAAREAADVAAYVHRLMDRDRKSPGLKLLQGLIWRKGYEAGELRGQVYADVPAALERWQRQGLRIYIYSSGSVLAQQLLFRSTPSGDLTQYLSGYFDTAVGPKTAPESYRAILAGMSGPPGPALFVSDVVAELDAAREAGLATALCVRPGWRDQPDGPAGSEARHPVIHSFSDIID